MKSYVASQPKFKPSEILIFEEADGFHFCGKSEEFRDARGKGYPSRAAAMRAAREAHEAYALYHS